jgi:DUF917 family protein
MKATKLTTLQDCEDFVEGSLWMATGGGGGYDGGMELLKEVIEEGRTLEWVDADCIDDDAWTATVGLHGSIAPLTDEVFAQIERAGLVEAEGEWYIIRAVKELGKSMGHEYSCIVPAELGPESAAITLAVGARMGATIVDGDYIGRAVPEETQSTYCLFGKQGMFFTSVDPWGNITVVKEAVNPHSLERLAKMLAVAAYGVTAVAGIPLRGREMKEILVPGTLTQCLKIGQALRQAREENSDPVAAGLSVVNGWRLCDGTVVGLETEDRDGYLFGTVTIEGEGVHTGQEMQVWFKNENQVTWVNGKPWVCSPDLVSVVHKDSGRGIYNAEIKEGDQVAVIGIRGLDWFRTEAGLAITAPRYFGFDIDYVPIEDLMERVAE